MNQRWELETRIIDGVPLTAPRSYWEMPESERNLIASGCGPGRIGDYLVPDTVLGLSIRPACHIHDWMYHFGRSYDDKRLADKLFLDNMAAIVRAKTRNRLLRSIRLRRIKCYYEAVVCFGGPSFHGGVTV